MNLTHWMNDGSNGGGGRKSGSEAGEARETGKKIPPQAQSSIVVPKQPQKMPSNDDLPGACRVQSPSSILTYRQCPRKYYYRYIEKLPSEKSIHLIRGSVVHKVLEDIYDVDVTQIPAESFLATIRAILQEAFRKEWMKAAPQLAELKMAPEELEEYERETRGMIDNFYHYLREQIEPLLERRPLAEAWELVKPQRETYMESPTHLVRGYIDVIQQDPSGITYIMDYKTSKKLEITPEYRLQLGIYAMMHEEKHHTPDEVGILFLKHGKELREAVTPVIIEEARRACLDVQLKTKSEALDDYAMKPGPLCKWRTGQCEFYDLCFSGMPVARYRALFQIKNGKH